MAKFRLPSGVGTKVLAFRTDGGRVVLRFNKKGEAQCADKHTDAVKRLYPNLELLAEQVENE